MEDTIYTINVFGKKPEQVQVGFINKTSGQPEGNSVIATQELGEVAIPNYSTAWGKLKKGTDKKLTGDIEFLPWGSPAGELIEIRHLRNCPSLSIEFQKEKKLVVTNDQAEISLKIGHNKFKYSTQKLLIEMLKHHGLNRSNGSRNPENKMTRFETFIASEKTGMVASEIQRRQLAEGIVLEANNKPANLEIMAKMFDIDTNDSDEVIFNKLISYSQNPKQFLEILKKHADKYKALLTKALEVELIDLGTEDTVTIVIGGAKDILMTGIEGEKIEDRIEYITDHITEAQIYHALNRLSGELERYKSAVLQ